MFNIVRVTARSLTLELINEAPYQVDSPYAVYLDGVCVIQEECRNVCSLFDLEPTRTYTLMVKSLDGLMDHEAEVTTKDESVQLDVKKFGAMGDGIALDSLAIQAAILACPKGGTVTVPKGTYLCAPLFLKSHMTLELKEGATLLGHLDPAMYPVLPGVIPYTDESDDYNLGTWEGNPLDHHAGLITGLFVEDVAIIGKGVIDGNAAKSTWWVKPKIRKIAWRPRNIFLNGCSQILFQGPTIKNSPSWTVHPYFSNQLDFIDLNIENPKDSPNTDGLDPESCQDVRVIGVHFSVGDDCIAIKSGKLYMGKKYKQPSERFQIRNCHMRHGHGAVVIGSEIAGGARDIHVSKCIFEETDRGLRIKTRRGRGEDSIVDRITFDKIYMNQVLTPFVMNMFYFCDPDGKTEYVWSKKALDKDGWTPYLGHFRFKDIECVGAQVAAAYFRGLPEQPIAEIIMEDIQVTFAEEAIPSEPAMMSHIEPMAKKGIVADCVDHLQLKNVNISGYVGQKTNLTNVKLID